MSALPELELTDYAPHIFGGPRVKVFLGARIALVLDAGCSASTFAAIAADPPALAALVARLETLLALLDDTVGRVPALNAPLHGRVRLEVGFLPRSAAGLAHHGVAGIAVGPAFVENCVRTAGQLDHVFTYEFMRNYIFADFTDVFDYHCLEGEASWGWVNQGFINIFGALVQQDMAGTFNYHGYDAEGFFRMMENDLAAFLSSGLSWEAAFLHERFPWEAGKSLDNLYSGLLVVLWRAYGRRRFLRRWFRGAIPLLHENGRRPAGKGDWPTAAENFFLAACYSAADDLTPYFVGTLRWPLRAAVAGPAGDVLRFVLDAARADTVN